MAEAEGKYEQVMEINIELEKKNSDLMTQVNALQGSVQRLDEELSLSQTRCNEITRVSEKILALNSSLRNIVRICDVSAGC